MKQLAAFSKKEWMELLRNGKCAILVILFLLFGIMNPAIAKLTPWLVDMMSDSLSETGMTIAEIEINALTSWTQFYKNMPISLIIFLLLFSSTVTGEYQKGTLIHMITKGMVRWKILVSKALVLTILWTAGYWISYGITYAYNAYYWDNGIASGLAFSAFCFYLTGIWLITLLILMSAFFRSNSAVILGIGGVFGAVYLLGLLQDVKPYLPAQLLDSASLLMGRKTESEYLCAVAVTAGLLAANLAAAVMFFRKRKI